MKKALRLQVYAKCGGHCAYCGKPIEYEAMRIDRIVPHRREGHPETDELENYNPSCRPCIYRKGRLSVEGFRSEIRHQAEAVMVTFQARMSETYGLLEYHPEREVKFYFETH